MNFISRAISVVAFAALAFATCGVHAEPAVKPGKKLRALIVDGQNNHDWQMTTPLIRLALESCGRFTVDVATTPKAGADMSGFRPKFTDYDVMVSNYNGERWPSKTEEDFEKFVAAGGGFVSMHSAITSFPDWPAYNRICQLSGWAGRSEKTGPYVYLDGSGKIVTDSSSGPAGHHGPQHEFQIRTRAAHHPITEGLPAQWMHTKDELYDSLRGHVDDLTILATAYSSSGQDGTQRHEPMLMSLTYGRGRVFHTLLGHSDYSMKCVGFITTLQRGAEWAASGEVTIAKPADFPTAHETSSRP